MIQSIIVARLLGPENLGMYAIVVGLGPIFLMISLFGMPQALVRVLPEYIAKEPDKVTKALTTFFWLSILTTLPVLLVYFILTPYLSIHLYNEPRLIYLIYLSIIAMFVATFGEVFGPIMQAYQKIPLMAKLDIGLGMVGVGFTISFAYFLRLEGVFYAGIVIGIASLCTYCCIFRHQIKSKISELFVFDKKIARYLIFFGAPTLVVGLVSAAVAWFGITILQRYADFSNVGLFRVADRTASWILFIPNAVMVPFLPIAVEIYTTNRNEFRRLFYTTLKYIMLLTLPICMGLVIFSAEVITLIYSDVYVGASLLVIFTAAYTQHLAFGSPAGYLYYLTNNMRRFSAFIIIGGVMHVIFIIILVPQYLAIGLVLSTLVISLVGTILNYAMIRKPIIDNELDSNRFLKYTVFDIFLTSFIFFVGITFINYPQTFVLRVILFLLGMFFYYIILVKFLLNNGDKEYIKKLIKSVMRKLRFRG